MKRVFACPTIARLFAAAIAVFSSGVRADDTVDPVVTALLVAHNRERAHEHKGPLELSPRLCESAAIHARDMASRAKLDHTGGDGSTVADRVKRIGYAFVRVGENIARGQKKVDQVMESWMKSAGHRANIMAEFTEMGAARLEDDDGLAYWCVNFGIPMPRLKPEAAAAAVVKQLNDDRATGHLAPLKSDPELTKGAMALSAAMAAKDSLEIEGDPFKLIGEKATKDREIRLMMSANVPTAAAAARQLAGDDPEPLSGFREIGVGYAVAKSGTPYWCAIFARSTGLKRPGRPDQ